jgi:hypothetical protein
MAALPKYSLNGGLPDYAVTRSYGASGPPSARQTGTPATPTQNQTAVDSTWFGIGSGVSGPAAAAGLLGQADSRFPGASEDTPKNPFGPQQSAAASASNAGIAYRQQQVDVYNSSGLNATLQKDLASGNFAAAFNSAISSGQLNAMLDPMNLAQLFPNGMTEAQMQAYYTAFAPIQKQLYNKADPSILGDNSVWNNYSTSEASQNWQDTQNPTLADPYKDLPNPMQFSHDPSPTDFEMELGIIGAGVAVVAPEIAPEVGAALGVGSATSGAIVGGLAGGASSYGLSGGNVQAGLRGAVGGAAGGFLAGGGASQIATETGLPQGVVSTGIRTGVGALTGGSQGAEAAAIGGVASEGLQTLGASQSLSGAAGQVLGARATDALNSNSGTTMATTGTPNYQLNDPAAQTAIGATGSLPTSSSGLPNYATSGTSPGLSSLDTTGLLAGIGIAGEAYGQSQTNSIIQPLNSAGQTYNAAGEQLLQGALGNELTAPQQQVVNTAKQQGQTLINAATPAGQIANQLMTEYQSGTLNAADQASLIAQVTAAKAQIAQALGPNADSTTLANYYSQIDQQALITKQTMLNNYLATGNQEFDQWSTTTQAGQAAILAGQQYAVTAIDNNFQEALGAGSLGGQQMSTAIQQQLQSNSQLASAFSSYMGNLAKSYALTQASGAGGQSSSGAPQYTTNNPNLDASPDQGSVNAASDTTTGQLQDPSTFGGTQSATDINSDGSSIMSQISPNFGSSAQSSLPSYASYVSYA